MKLNDWLNASTKLLASTGIPTARLDCLVLLEDALGKDKSWLLAHPDYDLENTLELDEQIKRRTKHEPLAYIRGFTEFYGRRFAVDKRVLEPRPESETMIELLMSLNLNDGMTLADVGTGSGALGITAKLVRPGLNVTLIDIDNNALKVAKQNVEAQKIDITVIKNDLLVDLDSFDIILANLPYVPDNHAINQAATNEPKLAIFGGPDGLDLYRRLYEQIANLSQFDSGKPQYILTESLPFQHTELTQIAKANGYALKTSEDFIQVFELDLGSKIIDLRKVPPSKL